MKLKILHIIPNLRKGGAERLVIDLVRELSKKEGINIKLILFDDKIEYNIDDIQNHIQIIPSSIDLSLIRKNKLTITSLQNFINDFQPNIIHSHLFEAEIISRSCFYPSAKWFSHCHDNMIQFENFSIKMLLSKKKLITFYEKKYLFGRYSKNKGTYFIAISNDAKIYFEETAKPYQVNVLNNAIDFKLFSNTDFKNPNKDIIRLVNVGSFVDKKNQSFLIGVARILKSKNILFEIHFLGDGPNRIQIEKEIKNSNLEGAVFLHGNVEHVEKYLWQADIYVHSATYEPLGLVLIEAMAAGLPVITLDGRGNRDLIEQGRNGYMLFENNQKKYAEVIMDLWNDIKKYQEISVYTKQFAAKFDIKDYVANLLNLYSQ